MKNNIIKLLLKFKFKFNYYYYFNLLIQLICYKNVIKSYKYFTYFIFRLKYIYINIFNYLVFCNEFFLKINFVLKLKNILYNIFILK